MLQPPKVVPLKLTNPAALRTLPCTRYLLLLLMFGDHVRAYVPVADLLADAVATPLWAVIVTGPFTVALGMIAWIQARYSVSVHVPPI